MIIKLSPQSVLPQQDVPELKVSKRSDVLTINGQRLDFRPVTEGATLPQAAIDCPWIAGDVTRIDGQLTVTILIPYGPGATNAVLFPQDIVDPADGNLELPT
jgi:hypothetical protein